MEWLGLPLVIIKLSKSCRMITKILVCKMMMQILKVSLARERHS